MPALRTNHHCQTAYYSQPLPGPVEQLFGHIKSAMRGRNHRSEPLNLASGDLGHYVLNRCEVIERAYQTTSHLEIWHEYEIGHHLRQRCVDLTTSEINDLTNLDRSEQRVAKKVHQVFRHAPYTIPNINYVRVADIKNLSSAEVDTLEVLVANEANSWISLRSREVDPHWNPLLNDNPDQWLQGLSDMFEGLPIRMDIPQDPAHIPYMDGPNCIH